MKKFWGKFSGLNWSMSYTKLANKRIKFFVSYTLKVQMSNLQASLEEVRFNWF